MIRKWRKKCEIEQKIISFFIVGDCYTEAICAPRTPRTMAKENRTESWGWGKVKVKLYNIIVAKRFDSTSLRLSAKIARFLYVFSRGVKPFSERFRPSVLLGFDEKISLPALTMHCVAFSCYKCKKII